MWRRNLNMAKQAMQAEKGALSNKQVNIYGAYLMFSSLAAMVQMTYLTIFMTDTLMISAGVVATTLLIARAIDLVIGILSGGIIEKAHLKWGRYRSWLLIGRWFIIFGIVCSFFDTSSWPIGFRVGVAFVGYILLNVTFSFVTNAYYALAPCLAKGNMTDRFRLSARGAQFMCVAMLITSALTVPLVTALTPVVGAGWGYMIVALIFAIPYIFGVQMLNGITKECDPDNPEKTVAGPQITIKDMVLSVVKNNQMLVMFIAYSIYYIGLYTIQGLSTYYFMYIVGDYMKLSISMTVTMITGTIASLFVPQLGKKLGKKRAFVSALVIYALAFICVYFFVGGNWILYTVFGVIGGAFVYLFTGFGPNYFIDCGEYYLYKTGKDTRNIAIAMFSVPMKIGMMLGGAIAIYGLDAIGYQAGIQVTPVFQNHFMFLLGIIPSVLVLIGALITGIFYKLTDEKAAFYAEENAKKMREQMNTAKE